VAVIGETLLLAVDWGEVLAINIKNGDQRMPLLKAPSTFHVRDLCADDKGLAVVGIAGGQIVGWSRSKLGDWQNWGFWTWEKLTPTDNAVQEWHTTRIGALFLPLQALRTKFQLWTNGCKLRTWKFLKRWGFLGWVMR
jgi:hypothetical protein